MITPRTPPTPNTPRPVPQERRSGKDRRQNEAGPLTGFERRRTVEPRLPEVVELELSHEELHALGFVTPASPPTTP